MQNPNGLASKIMKEKYYPSSSFFEAPIGRQPSYIWRSFWNARSLLLEGLSWKVGDGTKIGIWTDKWVEKAPRGYLQSPTSIIDRN
jgi:hypothetical protein